MVPVASKMSTRLGGWKSTYCIDGIENRLGCHTNREKEPWLVIDYGSPVKISGIVIIPWAGYEVRAKNLEVRVSDEMPVKGQLFTGGQRLGSNQGTVSRNWKIEIASESGIDLLGRYLIVQSNIGGGGDYFGSQEVKAWGIGRR